jgi:hypothetical protein
MLAETGIVMKSTLLLALSIAGVVVSSQQISAQDLSTYRDFRLGMSLADVAKHAEIPLEPRVIQQRPALIQELTWQPQRWLASTRSESLKKIQFSFYNGQLSRMVVTYDRDKTEGLTVEDMTAAISATYGLALLPTTPLAPSAPVDAAGSRTLDDDKILAGWADSEHSIDLFQSPYQMVFGLVVRSRSIDGLAQAALTEGARLDAEEAPQREIDRQQKSTDDKRVRTAAARQSNKQTFRP